MSRKSWLLVSCTSNGGGLGGHVPAGGGGVSATGCALTMRMQNSVAHSASAESSALLLRRPMAARRVVAVRVRMARSAARRRGAARGGRLSQELRQSR
jgi:hypothetical protein